MIRAHKIRLNPTPEQVEYLLKTCGVIKSDLTIDDRMFICECGYIADRDLDAAQNIEREALRLITEAGVSPRTL